MSRVKDIIDGIIRAEAGYVNHKDDLGGATKYGITEKVARAYGYKGDMKDLPRELAHEIYLNIYWIKPGFDRVAELSAMTAEELCDTGVNCGVETSKPMLQRALNALNRQAKDFPDVEVDGQIGTATLMALAKFLAFRGVEGERVLVKTLNCLQAARYMEITESREKNESFFYGWMLHRVNL